MAAVLARTCLSALCCLALPALAQDASFGFGEQTTHTDQTTQSSSTQTQSSGAVTTQTTTSGSSQSGSRSESKRSTWASVSTTTTTTGADRRGGRDVRDSDLFGSWTLGQENGNTCSIELKNIEWFGGYSAYVPAGCPDGFFSANRWVSGNQLLLTDTSNTVFGRFRASGGGRWTGYRESDGARLYLNPKGH
jgi:hypothetical protein